MSRLERYVNQHCTLAGTVKLKDFAAAFAARSGERWTRARLIAELTALGFAVGEIDKVVHVAPLSLVSTAYVVRDGHLVATT